METKKTLTPDQKAKAIALAKHLKKLDILKQKYPTTPKPE